MAAVAVAALVLAPAAHADRTLSATQACGEIAPGTRPHMLGVTDLVCLTPEQLSQGTPPGAESLRSAMARVFPGSYQLNPADRWSDWVVPD